VPELPEVQTVVNDLQILTSDTITGFWTDFDKALKSKNFTQNILGAKIVSVQRMSKNIVFELEKGYFLMIHLKMTGKLLLMEHKTWSMEQNTDKHVHHVFSLKNKGVLEFHDIRKVATLELVSQKKLQEILKIRGIDPISRDFTLKKFKELLISKKNKNIKSFLMDQSAIAGIGNIYASEIPYHAKLHPLRKVSDLKANEVKILYKAIRVILEKAIQMRGTSISDYRDANGKRGSFQHELKVYKKTGENCKKCDTIIEKVVVEQRSTFYCSKCQH
jgi:formamidopyrimidine-DNA glycosylase